MDQFCRGIDNKYGEGENWLLRTFSCMDGLSNILHAGAIVYRLYFVSIFRYENITEVYNFIRIKIFKKY